MTHAKNILIVTYNWPPRNAIGSHRPYAWAKRWSEIGLNVTVLTSKKCEYDEPLDLFLPVLNNVKILEVPYRKKPSKNQNQIKHIKLKIINLLKKHGHAINKIINRNIDIRDAWAKKATPLIIDHIKKNPIDVVVTTYGPRACHLIGKSIKEYNNEIMWVADYRDLWSLRHDINLTYTQKKKEKAIEKKTMAHADFILTVSDPLRDELHAFLKKPTHTIYNGFDIDKNLLKHRITNKKYSKKDKKTIKIVYTGMIYPGSRDPSPLFSAIHNLISSGALGGTKIEVHFFGNKQEGIRKIIEQKNAADFTHVHGHVTREEALWQQADADLLLLMESDKPEAQGVLTGKIFEYLASGTPIISLGSPESSSIAKVINKTKTGFICENRIDKISSAITAVINSDYNLIFNPQIDEIMKYCRSTQSEALLTLITETHRFRHEKIDRK